MSGVTERPGGTVNLDALALTLCVKPPLLGHQKQNQLSATAARLRAIEHLLP